MRIALWQGPGADTDPRAALELAAARAATARAALLVTPEMALTGYNIGAAAAAARAEPADGPLRDQVAGIATAHGIAIAYGYPERSGERVYNAVQVVAADGSTLAGYRKCHLFGSLDRAMFAAGDDLVVQCDLGGLRVGLLICYDVEFPEAVRAHALAGTELLLAPTALMRPYEVVATAVVPARAYESQVFLAYVNRCDAETSELGELDYCGLSTLAAPDGTVLVRAGDGEELVIGEVDAAALHASRQVNTHLQDRRPELYALRADAPHPGQELRA